MRPSRRRPLSPLRRGRRLPVRLVAFLVGLLVLTGCAAIPNQSAPRVVKTPPRATQNAKRPGPEKGASPLQLVRSFVSASANPSDDHAEARAYLTGRAAHNWNASKRLTVIANTFDTVPSQRRDHDPNTRKVVVRGTDIGRLDADGSFRPDAGDFHQSLTLRKQSDGQWRIADPKDGVFVTLSDFLRYYRRVRVYFFDNRLGVPVPDLRYTKNGRADDVAGEVIDLLLAGPSESLRAAVHSAIPKGAVNKGSLGSASDGARLVNLGHIGEQSAATKRRIAEQLVLSLRPVTRGGIRIQADGEPMFPNHPDWRASDLPSSYQSMIHPDKDSGLVVSDHQLYTLDGKRAPGPAGSGSLPVLTAAQSIDGTRLAVVAKSDVGMRLRVGRYGDYPQPVGVDAGSLTRPTWAPGNATAGYAVWTVADGHTVIRVSGTGDGVWHASKVDATSLTQKGTITALRLSRDGVHVAAVVDGKLVVAPVLRRKNGTVKTGGADVLQGGSLTSVVDVAWKDQTTLVVATKSGSHPVAKIPVDGLQDDPYGTANLTPPVTGVTAAPGRPVVVVDHDGLWTSTDTNSIWTPNTFNPGRDAVPFYPG